LLLHAALDPERGERCECGAYAVVAFVLPLRGDLVRLPWCGEKCGACANAQPTTYQLWQARRRLRRWWRSHDLLGETTELGDDPTLP
jgi:hypothetical protein